MTGFDVAVFAAKLLFGTLAFLVIGYLGSSGDRRIAGTMLTFPVLNGIGLVTSPDQDAAALTAAMMPVIVLNACLCFGFIVAFRLLRPRAPHLSASAASYRVAAAGAAVWSIVTALLLPPIAPVLPSSGWIAALYLLATTALTPLLWSARPSGAGELPRAGTSTSFFAFWRRRGWRFGFFVISLFVLLVAAEVSDAAWIGRLSALPLVPLCVLAGLAIDDEPGLPALRDPILIGPGIAMLLVLPLTAIVAALRGTSGLAYWAPAIAALFVGWALCIAVIRFGVPALATALDHRAAVRK
jgi:hypothetical protein